MKNTDSVCDQFVSNLFIGNCSAAQNPDLLRSKQITHIITLGSESLADIDSSFVYQHLQVKSFEGSDFMKHFKEANILIYEAIKEGGKVFVYWQFILLQSRRKVLKLNFDNVVFNIQRLVLSLSSLYGQVEQARDTQFRHIILNQEIRNEEIEKAAL